MSDHAATVHTFWETTEARDWDGLSAVLSPDMVYEMEQTRERVRGREAFVRFFREFPATGTSSYDGSSPTRTARPPSSTSRSTGSR